jgi:nicotinate-nucleotide adenylyltransferase
MKIGILGSSFNPPHDGHLKISNKAITLFNLNEVWWMITKQNPLKDSKNYLPLEERIEKISSIINTKKIKTVYFEDKVKSNFLIDNIKYINQRFSKNNFIFLMGSDSFSKMSQWKDYDEIFHQIPIVIFNRQSSKHEILNSKIAKKYEKFRLDFNSRNTIYKKIPSWIFIHDFNEKISSSNLRSI